MAESWQPISARAAKWFACLYVFLSESRSMSPWVTPGNIPQFLTIIGWLVVPSIAGDTLMAWSLIGTF